MHKFKDINTERRVMNMCSVIMSIKPEFVYNIFTGEKVYEFRKKLCKRQVNHIYIYSTNPIRRIVGEAEIEFVLVESPETIWKLTQAGAGIKKDFFDRYFENRDEAVAYKLSNVKKYKKPLELSDFGLQFAPQSYQYIER